MIATLRLGKTEEISVEEQGRHDHQRFHGAATRLRAGQEVSDHPARARWSRSQFPLDFNFLFQYFAANGYVVVAMNPRGSSGRGEKFCTAIYADWGNKDVQDVLAGVD